ncbi:MAG: radical SAM protein [Pseudomonadota bacterium]
MTYKYALSITSQASFCSTPIRLDTYSACQFGCAYCFAKSRGGNISKSQLNIASARVLKERLKRVRNGKAASALDVLLQMRVPIQLGGMTDPFSPWEEQHRASLELLRVLQEDYYPTLISTKSLIPSLKGYAEILRDGNFYVRISFTGATPDKATALEAGVPSSSDRFRAIEKLSNMGIPVSTRLQPLIPGQEEASARIIQSAANAGAKHVSVEYLKVPLENSMAQTRSLDRALPGIRDVYRNNGARRVGREYTLPPENKILGHELLSNSARALGIVYGYADNEFLLRNSFRSCCNAADLFLENAGAFDANILGVMKRGKGRQRKLLTLKEQEIPQFPMDNYLNSRSRPRLSKDATAKERWLSLLREKWNAPPWRGGPASFWQVHDTGERDIRGDKVFEIRDPLAA